MKISNSRFVKNQLKKQMVIYRFLKVTFVILFVSSTCFSQELEVPCFLCKSAKSHHKHESPYINFSVKKESLILGGVIGLSASTLLVKSPRAFTVNEIKLLDPKGINNFDRYAISKNSDKAQRISDILLTGVLVLPSIFLSNHHTRKDVFPLLIMSAETVLINITLTNLTKKLVRRARPLVYNLNFPIEEKTTENARLSFFSGHTSHTASLSFLIAKVITDYHPHVKKGVKVGVWVFAASVPAVTGYLRIRAGKHFPTDTITGFIVGGLVGVLVPYFHKQKKSLKHKKIRLSPALGVGMVALGLQF